MRLFSILVIGFGLTLSACSASEAPSKTETVTESVNAKNWELRGTESRLEFISVKKGAIVETHSFADLSGTVLPDGSAVITINLDSVETNIDIRNARMKQFLFETDKSPRAMIKAQLDPAAFAFMSTGERKNIDIPVTISLNQQSDVMDIGMVVTRLGDNKVVVDSRTPVIIDTDKFNFAPGILKLQELAKLPSITPEIPVMFSLVFER